MELTAEDVQKVALLAQLHLLPGEVEELTQQLRNILQYMEKLNELDTSRIEPFTHPVNGTNRLREDIVSNTPNADAILANAPSTSETFFRVPKIIE
jgi:aspartyl-tRNA(Asn)/glutamyl-tRNA(Gln) amidotransferase subunit C